MVASARRPVLLATTATTISVAPVFLVGAQAVQIGESLHLNPATLGATVSVFFAVTAVSSVHLGRAVSRWGVRVGLTAAMSLSVLSLVGLALSRSVLHMGLLLALAGLANGASHPCSNMLIASGRSPIGLGLSLGIKQSAPPAASLVAGLAVPAVALTLGWRWSFAATAVLGLLLVFAASRVRDSRSQAVVATESAKATSAPISARLLALLALISGCGAAAGNALGTFMVSYGVHDAGLAPGAAGLAYALASVSGVGGRLAGGWLMDRARGLGPLTLSATVMVLGAAGHLMVSTGVPVAFVVGAVIAYGFGWAWAPLVQFAVLSSVSTNPARATGVLMTGFASGSCAGPLVVGQLADRFGYDVAWYGTAALNVFAGLLLCVLLWRTSVAGVRWARR